MLKFDILCIGSLQFMQEKAGLPVSNAKWGMFMKENHRRVLKITQGALIAALYVVLTVAFAPISFGPLQLRVSEALIILPMFTSAAVPGLFVGCLLANILGGAVIWDVIFGSLATLIGAWLGYKLRANRWLVPLPEIAANALIIPFVLSYGYGLQEIPIPLMAVYIAAGEFLGCFVLGEILGSLLLRNRRLIFDSDE